MTDNKIIKALECCLVGKCGKCQMLKKSIAAPECECKDILLSKLSDLINRQKAEIDQFADIGKMYSEVRAEAIRDFAEELIFNLNEDISAYSNAGHGLNVYSWLTNYLISKGAIKYDKL